MCVVCLSVSPSEIPFHMLNQFSQLKCMTLFRPCLAQIGPGIWRWKHDSVKKVEFPGWLFTNPAYYGMDGYCLSNTESHRFLKRGVFGNLTLLFLLFLRLLVSIWLGWRAEKPYIQSRLGDSGDIP